MATTISKTTYTFTVLHPTDSKPADLEEALAEATDRHAVGRVSREVTVPVADEMVPEGLIALGNDGSLFDDDLDAAQDGRA